MSRWGSDKNFEKFACPSSEPRNRGGSLFLPQGAPKCGSKWIVDTCGTRVPAKSMPVLVDFPAKTMSRVSQHHFPPQIIVTVSRHFAATCTLSSRHSCRSPRPNDATRQSHIRYYCIVMRLHREYNHLLLLSPTLGTNWYTFYIRLGYTFRTQSWNIFLSISSALACFLEGCKYFSTLGTQSVPYIRIHHFWNRYTFRQAHTLELYRRIDMSTCTRR